MTAGTTGPDPRVNRRTLLRTAGIASLALTAAGTAHTASAQTRVSTPDEPRPPQIPTAVFSAAAFGAMPNTGVDQTSAIQAAIDSAASAGGGTVELEAGRYDVAIQPHGSALVLRPRVRLSARANGHTTVRIADDQGDYFAIVSTFEWDNRSEELPTNDPVHDIAVEGITFDMNGTHNPIHDEGAPFGPRNHQRAAIWVNQTFRMTIRNCSFIDSYSIQVILVDPPGESADVLIEHCSFRDVGGAARHYDHSTIYLQGHRMATRHCSFRTRFGAGTAGVVAALEVHGDHMSLTHNDISGYYVALNIVGGNRRDLSDVQHYAHNRISDVAMGGTLWHGNFGDNPYTLTNVTITCNTVDITGKWRESLLPAPTQYYGFATRYAPEAGIRGLTITHNAITFADMAPLLQDRDWWKDTMASGVAFHRIERAPYEVADFEVRHNRITNSPSAGIWSNIQLTDGVIEHNVIRKPGTNGRFSPAKEYPAQWPEFEEGYRTAVSLNGPLRDVTVRHNRQLD